MTLCSNRFSWRQLYVRNNFFTHRLAAVQVPLGKHQIHPYCVRCARLIAHRAEQLANSFSPATTHRKTVRKKSSSTSTSGWSNEPVSTKRPDHHAPPRTVVGKLDQQQASACGRSSHRHHIGKILVPLRQRHGKSTTCAAAQIKVIQPADVGCWFLKSTFAERKSLFEDIFRTLAAPRYSWCSTEKWFTTGWSAADGNQPVSDRSQLATRSLFSWRNRNTTTGRQRWKCVISAFILVFHENWVAMEEENNQEGEVFVKKCLQSLDIVQKTNEMRSWRSSERGFLDGYVKRSDSSSSILASRLASDFG